MAAATEKKKANVTKVPSKTKQKVVGRLGLTVITGGQVRSKVVVDDRTTTKTKEEVATKRRNELTYCKAQIVQHAHLVGVGFYELGLAFSSVKEKELWKEDGCGSFNEFVKRISGFTSSTVYNMIHVTKKLTVEQAGQFGPTLSYVVARATSKEAKAELVKLVEAGANVKKVRARAQAQRKESGVKSRSPGRPRKATTRVGKGPSKETTADLGSTESQSEHDKKVETVVKGSVKLVKGKGKFVVDGFDIEVKVTRSKLEFVARLR